MTAKDGTASTESGDTKHGYRVTMMYHPSHHVLDLGDAELWFERVFGRTSTSIVAVMGEAPAGSGRRNDYSTFTPINDVLFDTIDPQRYILGGVQRYPSVKQPHLKGFGWYVDGVADLYHELRSRGFRIVSQLDEVAEGDDPPTAGPMPLFFTVAEDAGLRYEFVPFFPFPLDPRVEPGWVLPEVSEDDPLGIECCSHHTVLTDRPERALRLLVEVLGGTVIHKGRDDVIGATSIYVHLADAVYELATPDEDTAAHLDWAASAPQDTYHAIAFKVADLDTAERHLRSQGVGIATRTDDTIVTSPASSLGVPWRFVTALTPGDPRAH